MELTINTAVPHGELARSLADKLRFYIAETPAPVGARLPSHREIAHAAGVSQVTARMAVLLPGVSRRIRRLGKMGVRSSKFLRFMASDGRMPLIVDT